MDETQFIKSQFKCDSVWSSHNRSVGCNRGVSADQCHDIFIVYWTTQRARPKWCAAVFFIRFVVVVASVLSFLGVRPYLFVSLYAWCSAQSDKDSGHARVYLLNWIIQCCRFILVASGSARRVSAEGQCSGGHGRGRRRELFWVILAIKSVKSKPLNFNHPSQGTIQLNR